jgi:hypothetical protein
MLRQGEQVPDLYLDPAFSRTNHWELSTSQLSSKFVDGWGYGEGTLMACFPTGCQCSSGLLFLSGKPDELSAMAASYFTLLSGATMHAVPFVMFSSSLTPLGCAAAYSQILSNPLISSFDFTFSSLTTDSIFTVVPDGYGLAYAIGDDYIRWTITSLKLDAARFKQCLLEAATETGAMMERAAGDAVQKGRL